MSGRRHPVGVADLALGHWAGVVPVRLTAGPVRPACDLPVPGGLAPTIS
jgi:uncharacterized protein